MTTYLASVWNVVWGDSEKAELVQKLVAKGVPENDASKAVNLCPRVTHEGKKLLLLKYMVDQGAKESEAVTALIAARGDTKETLRVHEDTFAGPRRRQKEKRNHMIKELMDLGATKDDAKGALETTGWVLDDARFILVTRQQRQLKKARRAYLAEKEKQKKLVGSNKSVGKVHRANCGSTKLRKQTRYSSHVHVKSSNKNHVLAELSESDDDHSTTDAEKMEVPREYHSSDDSESEEEGMQEDKHAETLQKKVPLVPASEKKKVFKLRTQISVPEAEPLFNALKYLNGKPKDEIVSGTNNLKNNKFQTGPPAEYLQLLTEWPTLLPNVVKTLEEKTQNLKNP